MAWQIMPASLPAHGTLMHVSSAAGSGRVEVLKWLRVQAPPCPRTTSSTRDLTLVS